MHGHKRNLQLMRKAPHIKSLLLWPSSRKLSNVVNIIIELLPQLELLSLDVVGEPRVISLISDKILVRFSFIQI